MNRYKLRFERDPSLDGVELLIRAPERNAEVESLIERLSCPSRGAITVFDGNGLIRPLVEEELVLASVEGKLVNIITEDGSWYTRRTLQSLEEELDARRFLRISRFEIVNLDKVQRYDFTVAGTLRLELRGGMETWASRRCIPAIRKRLMVKETEL